MGATMTGIIEWTEDAQSSHAFSPPLGTPRWHDDHLHGVLFQTEKEYEFFGAIAGVRGQCKHPLIPARGTPGNLSSPARRYFKDIGGDLAGWLHLSEIDSAIRHTNLDPFPVDFELEMALAFMRILVGKLSDPHVRLVFNIESP